MFVFACNVSVVCGVRRRRRLQGTQDTAVWCEEEEKAARNAGHCVRRKRAIITINTQSTNCHYHTLMFAYACNVSVVCGVRRRRRLQGTQDTV
ncbi:hypothetical protein J6590_046763 [Homalodisca vitripennis]|nr:hypothetical protein J6590_046763 [Homalodisca vitripennis]